MKSLGTKYVVVISGKEEREKEKGIGRGVVGCLAYSPWRAQLDNGQ